MKETKLSSKRKPMGDKLLLLGRCYPMLSERISHPILIQMVRKMQMETKMETKIQMQTKIKKIHKCTLLLSSILWSSLRKHMNRSICAVLSLLRMRIASWPPSTSQRSCCTSNNYPPTLTKALIRPRSQTKSHQYSTTSSMRSAATHKS